MTSWHWHLAVVHIMDKVLWNHPVSLNAVDGTMQHWRPSATWQWDKKPGSMHRMLKNWTGMCTLVTSLLDRLQSIWHAKTTTSRSCTHIKESAYVQRRSIWNTYLERRVGCYFQCTAEVGSAAVTNEYGDHRANTVFSLGNIESLVESTINSMIAQVFLEHISKLQWELCTRNMGLVWEPMIILWDVVIR